MFLGHCDSYFVFAFLSKKALLALGCCNSTQQVIPELNVVLQEHHATGQAEEMDRLKKLLATMEKDKEKKDKKDRKEKTTKDENRQAEKRERMDEKRERMDEAAAFQETMPPPAKKRKEKEAEKSKVKEKEAKSAKER